VEEVLLLESEDDLAELSLLELELEPESDFESEDDLESVEDLESEDELSLFSTGGLGRP
tara:strand:- start:35 stop:211 length:177 start_codon:yes stop_codon:yes gene_type:complete